MPPWVRKQFNSWPRKPRERTDRMSSVIDDLSRILASPLPRRQAFKLMSGAIAGALLGALGHRTASAQPPACPSGTTHCGTGSLCCPSTKICCTTGTKPFCITRGKTCCGNTACPQGKFCCVHSGRPFCATMGKTCCGETTCPKGQVCCNGVCCPSGQHCVQGRCQSSTVNPPA